MFPSFLCSPHWLQQGAAVSSPWSLCPPSCSRGRPAWGRQRWRGQRRRQLPLPRMKAMTARSVEPHLQHQRRIVLKGWNDHTEIRRQTVGSYSKLRTKWFVHTHTHSDDLWPFYWQKETCDSSLAFSSGSYSSLEYVTVNRKQAPAV